MTMNVHIVGKDYGIQIMYEKRKFNIVDDINEAQIVQFIGGADINPQLYGEYRLECSNVNHQHDQRDLKAWREAPAKAMKIGICRG